MHDQSSGTYAEAHGKRLWCQLHFKGGAAADCRAYRDLLVVQAMAHRSSVITSVSLDLVVSFMIFESRSGLLVFFSAVHALQCLCEFLVLRIRAWLVKLNSAARQPVWILDEVAGVEPIVEDIEKPEFEHEQTSKKRLIALVA